MHMFSWYLNRMDLYCVWVLMMQHLVTPSRRLKQINVMVIQMNSIIHPKLKWLVCLWVICLYVEMTGPWTISLLGMSWTSAHTLFPLTISHDNKDKSKPSSWAAMANRLTIIYFLAVRNNSPLFPLGFIQSCLSSRPWGKIEVNTAAFPQPAPWSLISGIFN